MQAKVLPILTCPSSDLSLDIMGPQLNQVPLLHAAPDMAPAHSLGVGNAFRFC